MRSYLADEAKSSEFITQASLRQGALGFIGHAPVLGMTDPPNTSYGLAFVDKYLVRQHEPQWGHPQGLDKTHVLPGPIPTNAPVIFVAACKPGNTFLELWDIQASTPNRSLIVPVGDHSDTDLYQAAQAWIEILDILSQGGTVFQAVSRANDVLANLIQGPLRFRVIGGDEGRDVRIK